MLAAAAAEAAAAAVSGTLAGDFEVAGAVALLLLFPVDILAALAILAGSGPAAVLDPVEPETDTRGDTSAAFDDDDPLFPVPVSARLVFGVWLLNPLPTDGGPALEFFDDPAAAISGCSGSGWVGSCGTAVGTAGVAADGKLGC